MTITKTTPKYKLWGETDKIKVKHDREPNPHATWHTQAALMFTDDTKIYEEEEIPRIQWDISVNGRKEVLVMDCTPDCRQIYWYLESHPEDVYWTLRQMYEVDQFAYAKGQLDGWQYDMLEGMAEDLELGYPMQAVFLLEFSVDMAIGRIDHYLGSMRMG